MHSPTVGFYGGAVSYPLRVTILAHLGRRWTLRQRRKALDPISTFPLLETANSGRSTLYSKFDLFAPEFGGMGT